MAILDSYRGRDILSGAALVAASLSAHAQPESAYIANWCAAQGGEAEVTLPDGTRADCVTDTHAVEVERAANWKSGIGQALNYAFQTNLEPGIVLILGDGDRRYWYMLNSVIEHYGLPIRVWELPERHSDGDSQP